MGKRGHTASSVDAMFGNAKEGVRVLPMVATPPDLVIALNHKFRMARLMEPMNYHAVCEGKVVGFPQITMYHCFEITREGVRARETPESP